MVKSKPGKKAAKTPRHTPKFPNFIAAWRLHRGFTSKQALADHIPGGAVSRISLSRMESNKQGFRYETLEIIAVALECTPGDLLSVDPATKGVIFEIYESIPDYRKPQALQALRALARKRVPKQ